MSLVRLVYASKGIGIEKKDVENILEKAHSYNAQKNISGVLLFNNEYFLQCIEGSREDINKLYYIIQKDTRHKEVTIIEYCEVYERDFAQWSMAYLPDTLLNKNMLLTYSNSAYFNPYEMHVKSVYKLLQALCKKLPEL